MSKISCPYCGTEREEMAEVILIDYEFDKNNLIACIQYECLKCRGRTTLRVFFDAVAAEVIRRDTCDENVSF